MDFDGLVGPLALQVSVVLAWLVGLCEREGRRDLRGGMDLRLGRRGRRRV